MSEIVKNKYQVFTLNKAILPVKPGENEFVQDVAELCDRLNFAPKNIVQVGAANSGDLEYMRFIEKGAKAILFEPNPDFCQELYKKWGTIDNISIFNLGFNSEAGKFKFVDRWASTCLVDLASVKDLLDKPLSPEDKYFYANCARFEGFDNGNIDLLYLDCQGAEWFCLSQLRSRPKIISIELYYCYSKYKNPFLENIYGWFLFAGYTILAINESDFVFGKV